jgi:hypothetical protein
MGHSDRREDFFHSLIGEPKRRCWLAPLIALALVVSGFVHVAAPGHGPSDLSHEWSATFAATVDLPPCPSHDGSPGGAKCMVGHGCTLTLAAQTIVVLIRPIPCPGEGSVVRRLSGTYPSPSLHPPRPSTIA